LRTDGHRQRPTGNEAKEARAGAQHGRWATDPIEQIDDVESGLSFFRDRPTQAIELSNRVRVCIDVPRGALGQMLEGPDHRELKGLGGLSGNDARLKP
jgi:hypothetical protein